MVDFGTVLRGVLTLLIVVSQLCRLPLWDAAALCHSKAAVQPSQLSSLSVPTDVLFLSFIDGVAKALQLQDRSRRGRGPWHAHVASYVGDVDSMFC